MNGLVVSFSLLLPLGDEGSISMVGKIARLQWENWAKGPKNGLPFGLLSLVQTNVGWVIIIF